MALHWLPCAANSTNELFFPSTYSPSKTLIMSIQNIELLYLLDSSNCLKGDPEWAFPSFNGRTSRWASMFIIPTLLPIYY